jgi:hypothetical protein
MDDIMAGRILHELQSTGYYPLAATNRPMETLWWALNSVLLQMRNPLYWTKLKKAKPKDIQYQTALQNGLALLAAGAAALGTRQAVVSSKDGLVRRISFQPRPYGVNWTALYALDPGLTVEIFGERPKGMHVEVSDILFLASKTTHLVTRNQAGRIIDCVATYLFFRDPIGVDVVVREVDSGRIYTAALAAPS